MKKWVLLLLILLASLLLADQADNSARIRELLGGGKIEEAIRFTDECIRKEADQEFYLGWKLELLKIAKRAEQAIECARLLDEAGGKKKVQPAVTLAGLHLQAGHVAEALFWMGRAADRGLKDLRLFGGESWAVAKKEAQYEAILQRVRDNQGIGKPAPEFEVRLVDGGDLSLSRLRGKIVLVDFWATWCGPCVKTIPALREYHRKYHRQGFEILGVSLDRDLAVLKKYLEKEQIPWPVCFSGREWGLDPMAQLYGVSMIPSAFLIDRAGRLRNYNPKTDEAEAAIRALLDEPVEIGKTGNAQAAGGR